MLDDESDEANRNPAIERMMAILAVLERSPTGAGLKALTGATGVARSSVYRILNSLEAHGMVRQVSPGAYILGSRLLELATRVTLSGTYDLVRIAKPRLEQLSKAVGETSKISVYDRGSVLVIVGAAGTRSYALHTVVGQHLPLHAGAASKVLMAHLPPEELDKAFERGLEKYTPLTLTTREEVLPELEKIRAQGWSHDPGEFSINIHSFGAPIRTSRGEVIGALSVPFLAGRKAEEQEMIRDMALRTALVITSEVPG